METSANVTESSQSAGSPEAKVRRFCRQEAVALDLVLDRLQRAEEGLSRAEVLELIETVDGVASRLSEVAGNL